MAKMGTLRLCAFAVKDCPYSHGFKYATPLGHSTHPDSKTTDPVRVLCAPQKQNHPPRQVILLTSIAKLLTPPGILLTAIANPHTPRGHCTYPNSKTTDPIRALCAPQ